MNMKFAVVLAFGLFSTGLPARAGEGVPASRTSSASPRPAASGARSRAPALPPALKANIVFHLKTEAIAGTPFDLALMGNGPVFKYGTAVVTSLADGTKAYTLVQFEAVVSETADGYEATVTANVITPEMATPTRADVPRVTFKTAVNIVKTTLKLNEKQEVTGSSGAVMTVTITPAPSP